MRSSSLSCIVFTLDSFYMKEAFIKLHLSILIAGGTGIFGKLISLNEGLLVWYRMMFASVMFFLLLSFLKKLRKVTLGLALDIFLWKYQSFQCIHRRGLSFADEHLYRHL